ncbi:MAG: GIY-YIG nuclease family protein [Desulfurococcales archaeon]|nr:GIY-YIG nuclease family protein [Desulfurococcales archaeon]
MLLKASIVNCNIPPKKGVYALILVNTIKQYIRVGSLGIRLFKPGIYIYVGSALGPGGLLKRISRHLRREKKKHWHIDYLTSVKSIECKVIVWSIVEENPRYDYESLLAKELWKTFDRSIKGFGASDKKDYTHLYICNESLSTCINLLVNVFRKIHLTPYICLTTDLNTAKFI